MKLNITVDCTPEEARSFLGLPDLTPVNETLVAAIKQRIAANVRRLRTAQGLSQEELGHRAGLDRTYVSQIERAVKNATFV